MTVSDCCTSGLTKRIVRQIIKEGRTLIKSRKINNTQEGKGFGFICESTDIYSESWVNIPRKKFKKIITMTIR